MDSDGGGGGAAAAVVVERSVDFICSPIKYPSIALFIADCTANKFT